MIIQINKKRLAELLQAAKDEHTKLFGNDPNHDWVTWYAEYIHDRIVDDIYHEMSGIIGLRGYRTNTGKQITIHDFSSSGLTAEQEQDAISREIDEVGDYSPI